MKGAARCAHTILIFEFGRIGGYTCGDFVGAPCLSPTDQKIVIWLNLYDFIHLKPMQQIDNLHEH
jgi:hypothetical protein